MNFIKYPLKLFYNILLVIISAQDLLSYPFQKEENMLIVNSCFASNLNTLQNYNLNLQMYCVFMTLITQLKKNHFFLFKRLVQTWYITGTSQRTLKPLKIKPLFSKYALFKYASQFQILSIYNNHYQCFIQEVIYFMSRIIFII